MFSPSNNSGKCQWLDQGNWVGWCWPPSPVGNQQPYLCKMTKGIEIYLNTYKSWMLKTKFGNCIQTLSANDPSTIWAFVRNLICPNSSGPTITEWFLWSSKSAKWFQPLHISLCSPGRTDPQWWSEGICCTDLRKNWPIARRSSSSRVSSSGEGMRAWGEAKKKLATGVGSYVHVFGRGIHM